MISARDALGSLRLPVEDETEVDRIAAEIEPRLRPPAFDGRPIRFDLPAGDTAEERERTQRIACALQRRFQAALWMVGLETVADAYGEPQAHRLWFAIDAAACRAPEAVATPANAPTSPLRALHEELSILFGNERAKPLPDALALSVLLGTYDRLPHLRRAIESIRASVDGLSCEIVVTDGGSTDGSRAYLAAQPDVVLVGERRLDGAVKAFNQAHALSRGQYVANLNDDMVVEGSALAEAVRHLEANPRCGQVAFAFSGKGQPKRQVNEIYPGLPYANFGVARREVVDKIASIQGGFWHPAYRTYAADVEFSAWGHRLGYTVDAREDLHVEDTWAEDALREKNAQWAAAEAKRMRARWPGPEYLRPDGPDPRVCDCPGQGHSVNTRCTLARYHAVAYTHPIYIDVRAKAPAPPNALAEAARLCGLPLPEEERRVREIGKRVRLFDPVEGKFPERAEVSVERTLHVSLATDVDPQAGLSRALREHSGVYREVRWLADYRDDIEARREAILAAAREIQPTLVFLQLQMGGEAGADTVHFFEALRGVSAPSVVLASWNGDIARENSPWRIEEQVPLLRLCDLALHSSLAHVHALRAAGAHHAGYLQIGYDEEQYHPRVLNESRKGVIADCQRLLDQELNLVLDHDYTVSFLGSRYGQGDGFSSSYRWKNGEPAHASALRNEIAKKMREAFGPTFGLFGNGWDDASDIPLNRAHEIYWRSKIGLSVSLDNDLACYTSDRLFRILGCGTLLLVKRFPMMSVLGLKHGENCLVFDTAEEAVAMAKQKITDPVPDGIAEAGAALARERHTWSTRMKELQPYLDAVRSAR